jgi:Plasmid pRiA4b ORF-3-like protein
VRVELLHGRGIELEPPPGRIMLVGPRHTFAELAEAIDAAFARWDLSHLHLFELGDGRFLGAPDDDGFGPPTVDDASLRVPDTVREGETFTYVFDLGDDWTHRCTVEARGVDPIDAYGIVPELPVPIWGWGSIPDQYGRRTSDDTGEE